MMKPPTDAQRAILRDAARHPYGLAAPPPQLPPAPRIAVARALLGAGLLARAKASELPEPGLGWKLDGEVVLLRITEAGLRTIGAAPPRTSPATPPRPETPHEPATAARVHSTSRPRRALMRSRNGDPHETIHDQRRDQRTARCADPRRPG
jgi:hypothetical protein